MRITSRLSLGGQKSRYLMYQPYHMQAYYNTFPTFEPSVPKQFWQACQRGDTAGAVNIVKRYDVPFFAKFSHPFWRATMENFSTAVGYWLGEASCDLSSGAPPHCV